MALSTSKLFLAICSGLALGEFADASAFLGSNPTVAPQSVSEAEVQTSLIDEVRAALGPGTTDGHLREIAEILRPMYIALPKNEYGKLGHATVRHALHRFFLQRSGWSFKGLETVGDHRNTSSSAGILVDRVPDYIQDQLEERMVGHGLNLLEVAVLASTIEHLVHSEVKERLETAFSALSMPFGSPINNDQAVDVLETYMMAYVVQYNFTSGMWRQQQKSLNWLRNTIASIFPSWPETQKWVHQIHQDTVGVNTSAMLDFEAVLRTAERLGQSFGRQFGARECNQLQADLLRFEESNNGRVLISTFYQAALDGMWQFSENIDFLRQNGALDESSAEPSVIVPNYIAGPQNCLAGSNYYKVCCPDECDGLFSQIESKIASSHAKPQQILDLVQALPSATTSAPRELPSVLIERIAQIAADNQGNVPIHGRLFAQWMHHAYPRECAYPHVSGTTSPRTTREWKADTGERATLTAKQMKDHVLMIENKRVEVGIPDAAEGLDVCLPWTDEEEVFHSPPMLPPSSSDFSWLSVRNVMFAMTFSSFVFSMVRSVRSTMSTAHALQGRQTAKFYV